MRQPNRGLQPERTALAWGRTGLAVFVNALTVLRAGMQSDQVVVSALGVTLLIASGLCVVHSSWRTRHLHAEGARLDPPWCLIVATVWVVWIACLGGVASIFATRA